MIETSVRTDAEIQEDVLRELHWDTRVDETEVAVTVDQGVVTLTGYMRSYAQKIAAQEAAHRVRGVRDVANDITVRVPGADALTDAEIALAARQVLEWHVLVPHERIRTTVSDGWITLQGDVDRWQQREEAEWVVRHLAGVKGVANSITVSPPSMAPDDVRVAIEQALERQTERMADCIVVEVHEGDVILSGRVRTWHEKRAVLGAVNHAPGVQRVEDRLRVEPHYHAE